MLTFLRKIRHRIVRRDASDNVRKSMIGSESIRRYIFYAIGEIALVVIGILIALQINNWSEFKKERQRESVFLEAIRSDLRKDSLELASIIRMHDHKFAYFRLIDPEFNSGNTIPEEDIDTSFSMLRLFNRGRSFRSNSGTYNSLISDGQAHLITNRELFNLLQEIYTVENPHLLSVYESVKRINVDISLKWSREIKYPIVNNLYEISNKELISDLDYFHRYINTYSNLLRMQLERVKETINAIDIELAG